MKIWLVRHAKAGSRRSWPAEDSLRPLSRAGHRQADSLVRLLSDATPHRVVSSPALRCVQTLDPLAEKHALPIEVAKELEEGRDPAEALAWLIGIDDEVVACTHGDVILGGLDLLVAAGVVDGVADAKKGSAWVLDHDGSRVRRARYLPPATSG